MQEALNNIEKHAEAKTVQLHLAVQHDSLCLKIGDDGRGFDGERRLPAKKVRRGTGLVNMRERAASLGGTGEWVSVPNRGTTITVRVPRARNA